MAGLRLPPHRVVRALPRLLALEDWLARDKTTGKLPNGILQPEGMGLSALCQKCNVDLLGVQYVPSFVEFVVAGKQMTIGSIRRGARPTNARRARSRAGVWADPQISIMGTE